MAGVKGRSGSGGARPGAGRKPIRETFKRQVGTTEKIYAEHLEQAALNLRILADGGQERVERKYLPAGLVIIEAPLRDVDGNPILNRRGMPILAKTLAYPLLPPDQLVLVEEKTISLLPDREANIYISNRILGTPTVHQELTGKDGSAIAIAPVIGYEVVSPVPLLQDSDTTPNGEGG